MRRRGWLEIARPSSPAIDHWRPYPFPKILGGTRDLADLHVADRIAARAIVARTGGPIDAALTDRMLANRLERTGAAWRVHDYRKAFGQYRRRRLASLGENGWRWTLLTDIKQFYPSIDRELLASDLRRCGCDADPVSLLLEMLAVWQERDHLRGLPIGDESFGVLSTPVLAPLNNLLHAHADDHYIYGDDTTVFHRNAGSGRAVWAAVAELLAGRGLELNWDKTFEYVSPEKAHEAIENDLLVSLSVLGHISEERGFTEVWKTWLEISESDDPLTPRRMTEVHYMFTWFTRNRSALATTSLLRRRDIMQLTPVHAMDYLIEVARNYPDVAGEVADIAAIPPTPTTEALVLQAFRFAVRSPLRTDAFAPACTRVLDNPKAHAPTRAWAAMAHARTTSWRLVDALERAEAEPHFLVRRALVASTAHSDQHPGMRRLGLRALRDRDADLAAVCDMVARS